MANQPADGRHKKLIDPTSPWVATFITFVGSIAGFLGSLYTSEIQKSFPFDWQNWPAAPSVAFFWASFLATPLLFFWRQHAVDSARARSTSDLVNRATEFEELIRTLPPAGFLERFSEFYWQCSSVQGDALQLDPTDEAIEPLKRAIRTVLSCVASLAHDFDGKRNDVNYGANIMLFHPAAVLPDLKGIKDRLMFVDGAIDIAALEGVLDLRTDLSTNTKPGIEIDGDLTGIALPIPTEKRSQTGAKHRVLPGGPKAFAERSLDGYSDTKTLGDWCRTNGDFPVDVVAALEKYFSDRPALRSFVSFPLMQGATEQPVGVLNVHRNSPGLLRTSAQHQESLRHFSLLLAPFASILLVLLRQLNAVESSQQRVQ